MRILSDIGRIFYGVAIFVTGFQTIYYDDFPYMLVPPAHSWIPGIGILAYLLGGVLLLAGACIVLGKQTRPISLLLGGVLFLIFCFCFIPYELIAGRNYLALTEWENAEKELALCSGAFVVAGCFSEIGENAFYRFLAKLIPLGAVAFSITILSFGILHFQLAEDASTLVPTWIPYPLFWTYFAGAALIASGLSIILKIKTGTMAALLGIMIFSWFIVLHIPRVIAAPLADLQGEVTSAFIALAYSGIAFVIAGAAKKGQ